MHCDDVIDKSDEKKKLELIQFYNETKGGLDTVYELLLSYSTTQKANRWPMVIFYCRLNVITINARVALMAKKTTPLEYANRGKFLKLALSLIQPHKHKARHENAT